MTAVIAIDSPAPGITDGAELSGRLRVAADVCVIGTGAGGAPVAAELARGGARVVVLEEGRSVALSELGGSLSAMFAKLYRDGGQTMTVGNTPIMLPVGRVVGGTTFINSGTCLRTPAAVFDAWAAELGLERLAAGALDCFYDDAEAVLGVSEVTPELAGPNGARIAAGAERLGWSWRYLPRNARGCVGSGVCAYGCPRGAKQHTAISYLEGAHRDGAATLSRVRAERVLTDGRRVRGVLARARGGARVEVQAPVVVVAAGTLHTPGLLAASGVRSPWLGRNLSIHPATGAFGIADDSVGMGVGVPQSLAIDEFAGEGLMLEGTAGPPDYMAFTVPYLGDAHRELMLAYDRVMQFGMMICERSRGEVAIGRAARRLTGTSPLVRYDLCREDAALMLRGIERLAELLFAAGARRVLLPVRGLPELRDGELAPLRALRPDPRTMKLIGFHPLGTARMASSPDDGVCDVRGRVHGFDGLHVADGSAVPSALGVNPQLTIMALATRLGRHLLEG